MTSYLVRAVLDGAEASLEGLPIKLGPFEIIDSPNAELIAWEAGYYDQYDEEVGIKLPPAPKEDKAYPHSM